MTKIKATQYGLIHNLYYTQGLNKAEIGRMFDVSRERIRQILLKLSTEQFDTPLDGVDTENVRAVINSNHIDMDDQNKEVSNQDVAEAVDAATNQEPEVEIPLEAPVEVVADEEAAPEIATEEEVI